MNLFSRSLSRTAVACRVFVRGVGCFNATLARHHMSGNVVLEMPARNYYISRGETRYSKSGIPISELVSEGGIHFYAQSRAGDVWAAIHNIPHATPEVESITAREVRA